MRQMLARQTIAPHIGSLTLTFSRNREGELEGVEFRIGKHIESTLISAAHLGVLDASEARPKRARWHTVVKFRSNLNRSFNCCPLSVCALIKMPVSCRFL